MVRCSEWCGLKNTKTKVSCRSDQETNELRVKHGLFVPAAY